MKKYSTIHQHEPLRTPEGWTGEKKRFIAQLEEIFDDIYRRFGRLDLSDLSVGLRKKLASQEEAVDGVVERVTQVEFNSEHIETEISYIQEAQDATDESVKTLTEKVTTVEQTADGLERTITEVKSEVNSVDGSVTQLEERVLQVEESAEGLKIEVSEKVTQKDVDESIENIDEFHNTAVDINAQGMTINTTGSIRAIVDDVERLTIDETGVNAPLIVADEVRAGNIVEKHLSETAEWKGSIQASINALPKYLTVPTTLTVPAGTYYENIVFRGFMGNKLTVKLENGVVINGDVTIVSCVGVEIIADALGDAAIHPRSAWTHPVSVYYTQYARLENLQISGYRGRTTANDGTNTVVSTYYSNVYMNGCCVEYSCNYGCLFQLGTFRCEGLIGGCAGSDPTTNANLGRSIMAYQGAHGCVIGGKVPMAVNGYGASVATLLEGSSLAATAGGMTYVEPEYVTKAFTISKHCTYLYGVRRIRDDQAATFSQGHRDGYTGGNNNWRIGAIWFADAVAELAGKTVESATLTLRRATGGWSNPVPVYLGSVALAESDFTSTLTPAFTKAATYPAGSLKREAEATYDVTDLMSAIQSGHAIGVFEPRAEYSGDWSPAYSTFYGVGSGYEPVLTVRYK